jgi:transcriptional regulator with XRE-family HTH domain
MEPVGSYLRSLRRKSGLSLRELSQILGSVSDAQISRHERSLSVPGFLAALGYEAVFKVPMSEIFPGLFTTVAAGIEEQLASLEGKLNEHTSGKSDAAAIARRLKWISERKNLNSN